MQKKNKILILIVSETLFLIFILVILPSLFIKERPGISQTSFQNTLSLDTKNSYTQEIITDKSNLQTVSVLLKNPALQNTSHVNIELLDNNKNIIRSLTTSGVSIADPSWISFKFPFVPSKSGDKFFIKLTSDNPKTDTLFVYGNLKDKSIDYKTTYTSGSIKSSFKNTIMEQINLFHQRNLVHVSLFIIILIILNILLLISL